MKKLFVTFFCFGLLQVLFFSTANARPLDGFHEGPYITIGTGLVQSDFDFDQAAQTAVGSDFERLIGLTFGWNITDAASLEIHGSYATNFNSGRREHLIHSNISGKYSFIFDALTKWKTFQILPYLKGGISGRIGSLPGNVLASDTAVTTQAIGPSVGGGVAMMWHKYFYFGFDVQEDFLFEEGIHQDLDLAAPALAAQRVYDSGFKPSFSALLFVGVHY